MGKREKEIKRLDQKFRNLLSLLNSKKSQTKIAENFLKNLKEEGYDAYYFKRKFGYMQKEDYMKAINIILTIKFREDKYIEERYILN